MAREDFTRERVLISFDQEFASFYADLHFDDLRFVRRMLAIFPRPIQRILIHQYQKADSSFDANSQLRMVCQTLNELLPPFVRDNFDLGEQELREKAEEYSQRCKRFELRQGRASDNATTVYDICKTFAQSKGISAPEPDNNMPIQGCLRRLQDKTWWLRKMRKLITRKTEEIMLHLGKVNRLNSIYASKITVKNRQLQKQRTLDTLGAISIINEAGDQFSLRDIYDKNVSNPVLRRNELMTRMRGFENLSKELNHIGTFITLTCPSKFHNSYAKSGQRNQKWDGSTPYQAQQYLCQSWAKIRAEMDRQNIRTYGFRVAEPQHDGTPHWHMMLFLPIEQLEVLKAIVNHYAFQTDGDEPGARENRVKFVDIDPKKGSATGYIAKYISKNIDGANLDQDINGGDAKQAALHVDAWASCWGIRQFQQIGGVSVTVWREIRRIKQLMEKDEALVEIHQAADTGDWATYTKLMGGVFCKRKEQQIRPFYDVETNTTTGELKQSWFDGLVTKKLKGVVHLGREIITRVHQWRIEWNPAANALSLGVL